MKQPFRLTISGWLFPGFINGGSSVEHHASVKRTQQAEPIPWMPSEAVKPFAGSQRSAELFPPIFGLFWWTKNRIWSLLAVAKIVFIFLVPQITHLSVFFPLFGPALLFPGSIIFMASSSMPPAQKSLFPTFLSKHICIYILPVFYYSRRLRLIDKRNKTAHPSFGLGKSSPSPSATSGKESNHSNVSLSSPLGFLESIKSYAIFCLSFAASGCIDNSGRDWGTIFVF